MDAFDKYDHQKSNGQAFTTKDRDNDAKLDGNCAIDYNSAWWYNKCFDVELNRPYSGRKGNMLWRDFGEDISKSIIMIRRAKY